MNDDRYTLAIAREVGRPLITGTTNSLRLLGWLSLLSSLFWCYGLGSLIGFCVGLIGVLERNRVTTYPVRGLRLCVVGMALGLFGLVYAVVVYNMQSA
jgi:hypothetical protein